MSKLRAYKVYDVSDESIFTFIIAKTASKAKAIAYRSSEVFDGLDLDFIDLRSKWVRDLNIDNLPIGEVDIEEGLRRDFYGWIDGFACPICGEYEILINTDKGIMCEGCAYA